MQPEPGAEFRGDPERPDPTVEEVLRGDSGFLPQSAQSGEQAVLAEGHLFAQGDRRGPVIDAEDIKCHGSALAVTL